MSIRARLYGWLTVFVWKHTGWVPREWSRRDQDAMYRYWCGLVDARADIRNNRAWSALAVIEEALT